MTQRTPATIYRLLSARMPHHAGASAEDSRLRAVPATRLTEPRWAHHQVELAARLFGLRPGFDNAARRVLGTIQWYAASSVLVAPALESFAVTGTAVDPALAATTLHVHDDGRFAGAVAARLLGSDTAELGRALSAALAEAINVIGPAVGASMPALWAIAADSIANRLLWAGMATGEVSRCTQLSTAIADASGERMPRPRYVDVGAHRVVRRNSCCLLYQATRGDKCVSCPHQRPEQRQRRLRDAFG